VLALAWAATRFVGLRMGAPARGRLLRVLEHVPAGRDRSILLLEVSGRLYLVGATGQQIQLLDAIEDPETIRRIMESVPATPENPLGELIPASFKEALTRVLSRQPKAPASSGEDVSQAEAERLKEQIDRLRRLQK
jgi:flagellar biogenesis protein FliO